MQRAPLALAAWFAALLLLPGFPAAEGAGSGGPGIEPVYLVRISVRTTSREARLTLRRPALLIEAASVRTSRGDSAHFAGFGRGPLAVTGGSREDPASATFTAALTPGGAAALRFSVADGRGSTEVRLHNLNRRPAQLVKRVDGRARFVVGLEAVAERGPALGTEPMDPLVLAFYYLWYDVGDWTGDKPIASYNVNPFPYDSADPAVMDRHIQQARDAGIDGFVVSWQGAGGPPDQNLKTFVERLPPGFPFAIYLEILNPGWATKGQVVDQIDYALDTYASHPSYLRIGGRPVVYGFATRHVLQWPEGGVHPRHLKVWADVLEALEERGHDPYLVGEGRHFDPSNYSVFHGMHPYGTEDPTKTLEFNRTRSLVARAWAAVHGGPRRLYAASVIPGYDDRHIHERDRFFHFPREDGALYGRQWADATETGSDQALIVSFNEWPETTNIEPNADWGARYLELTTEYAAGYRTSR